MPGFSGITGDESIMFTDNCSFDGTDRGGKMTTNGQLWIGSTVLPHVQLGALTSTGGTIAITYAAPNINIETIGGATLQTLSDDVGTVVTPLANNIQLIGHVNNQSGKFSTVVAGVNLLKINPMSASRWIVDKLGFNGTHTTIASAMTSATSGDTIMLLPGTYTENFTIKPGVDITGYQCDGYSGAGNTSNVTIVGTVTMTGAGNSTISGVTLQTNNAAVIASSGSNTLMLTLINCNIISGANSATYCIICSNTGAKINIEYSHGNLSAASIAYANMTGGSLNVGFSALQSSGGTTTNSLAAGGNINIYKSQFQNAVTSSSTGGVTVNTSDMLLGGSNQACLTFSNATSNVVQYSELDSGSASAIVSNSSGTNVCIYNRIDSSNAAPISGSGSINMAHNTFTGSGYLITTTTQIPYEVYPAVYATVVTLTSAQIKTLVETPIVAVQAPGSGKGIIVVSAFSKFVYGGTNAFTNGQNLNLTYVNAAGTAALTTSLISSINIDGTVSLYTKPTVTTATTYAPGTIDNQPLVVSNTGTDITGNAAGDNKLIIGVVYQII